MSRESPSEGDRSGAAVSDEAVVEVTAASDGSTAGRSVGDVAADLGFGPDDRAALEDAAERLVEALRDSGGDGTIAIGRLSAESRVGIRLTARRDRRPNRDTDATSGTGTAASPSLCAAISALNRAMDEVTVTTTEGTADGTQLIADRWLEADRDPPTRIPVSIGAASRAVADDEPNGDSFIVKTSGDTTLVGVIDGLGHGSLAHEASTAARDYVRAHAAEPLASIFRGTDEACSGTRGVVMALARFDWTAGDLTFASVGNIDARVVGGERTGFVVRRGVVGANYPGAAVVTRDWEPSSTLVLSSDGLSTRWTETDIGNVGDGSADGIATRLLEQYGTSDDDATALVVTAAED